MPVISIFYGEIPKNANRLVKKWTLKNKKALLENWKRAQAMKPLERIPGEE